jgi:hypothetical protein
MSVITFFAAAPESTVSQSVTEVNSIDWDGSPIDGIEIDSNDNIKVMMLSQLNDLGDTVEEINNTVIFNQLTPLLYPGIYSLIDWLKSTVGASYIGKTRIVALLPGKGIPDHINNSSYYSKYTRYHIPLVTHSDVKIIETLTSTEENMLVGNVYTLSNTISHSFKNNSNITRIHLIVDLA